MLVDQKNLHVHLDQEVLNGGGYKSMLKKARCYRKNRERKNRHTIIGLK